MAGVKPARQLAPRLRRALTDALRSVGIDADVATEPVRGTQLVRAIVVAPEFERMYASERQEIVWRIIEQHFDCQEQLHISMVLTLTPDEAPHP